jgi:hypothetical protein
MPAELDEMSHRRRSRWILCRKSIERNGPMAQPVGSVCTLRQIHAGLCRKTMRGAKRAMMGVWKARPKASFTGRSSAEPRRFASAPPSRCGGPARRARGKRAPEDRPTPLKGGEDFGGGIE